MMMMSDDGPQVFYSNDHVPVTLFKDWWVTRALVLREVFSICYWKLFVSQIRDRKSVV